MAAWIPQSGIPGLHFHEEFFFCVFPCVCPSFCAKIFLIEPGLPIPGSGKAIEANYRLAIKVPEMDATLR